MELTQAIERSMAGDRGAYEHVVVAHTQAVVGLLRRLLGNLEDAREVAQDTFVRAYQNLHRYDPHRPLKPWLLRIARNLAYNHLRAQQRHPGAASLQPERTEPDRLASETPSPISVVLQDEQRSAVDLILGSLRPEFREVLVYRYMERLDYDEIALVMGIPVGTVKTWRFRAKEQFRRQAEGREIF